KLPLVSTSGMIQGEPLLAALSEEAPESVTTVLRSNTFPHTDHRILSYPDGAFMVLVEDDATRSAANRTRLKYSIYNGSAWTTPAVVDPDDATADYKPVAAATNDGVIAAWENINEVLADDAALEDALSAEEICTARYDEASDTWVQLGNLTNDSYMDCTPQIATSGSKAILVWLKSKSEDYSNLLTADYSAVNDICFSKWDGNAFSIPMTIASFDRPVMDMTVAYHGSGAIILFTVDEDKNLNTAADQEIYRMAYDGTAWTEPVKLTNNQVKDSNGQINYINGEAIAVWNQNGKILYATDLLSTSPIIKTALEQTFLQDTFTIASGGDGTLALVGTGKSGSAQELYAVTYDKAGDVWSSEMALTTDNALNSNPSAAFVENRLVSVYNRAQTTTAINPDDGSTYPSISDTADLVMIELVLTHNLAVSSEGIILSESNPQPGSLVTISAEIVNRGSYAETGMKAEFYSGNPSLGGVKIGQSSPVGTIAPGMSVTASVQWEVPTQNAGDTIYVVVSPHTEISDSDPADNKAFIHIQRPDLELSALECTPAGSGKYAVTVRAANIGLTDVQDALVTLYYGGQNGELVKIDTLAAGEIKAGEAIELPYLWSPSATVFQEGRVNLFATIDIPSRDNGIMLAMEVSDTSNETTLENNVRMVTVNQQYLGILNYSPANLQENVSIEQAITITFNNNLLQQIGPGLTLTGPGGITAGVGTAVNGDTLVITPAQQLQYATEYTLALSKNSVTDVNGRVMEEPWSITFTTASAAVVPLLQSLNNAAVNGTIKLPFSAGIIQGMNFNGIVLRNNALQSVPCTFACSGNILEIKPIAPLAYTSSYTVAIPAGALKNTAGTDLSAFTFSLNTRDESTAFLQAGLSQLTISQGILKPAFNTDTVDYQAEADSSTGSILITPVAMDGTMVITVNGSAVISGHASQSVSLTTGNNIITIDVTTADGKNVKTYTITVNRAPGDDGGSGADSGADSGRTASINAGAYHMNVQVSSIRGTTTASLSNFSLNAAFEKAAKDGDGISTVNIQMPEVAGSTGYAVKLPAKVLTSDRLDQRLSVTSPAGILTLPVNMLNGVNLKGATNVEIRMSQVDPEQLPQNVQKLVGARPVVELKLISGTNTLEWSNPDAPVKVSIPYTPTAEELKDPEHITIWYIDGKGNIQSVPTGKCDPQTGRVTFTTTHFSYYAAAFAMKTFSDLDKAVWARKPVEVLASKGILEGKTEAGYDPMTEITRADFLYYLVRALGADARVDDNFEDIKPDALYYKEIGIAKKLGITNGTGGNLFKPGESITRQDMMVLTVRALRLLNRLKQQGAMKDLDRFSDKALVADYAVDAVAATVSEGLIIGNNGKVNPRGNTNRAEAAMFLYRIYNKY
ncbi:MAG: S-layer homology domain-containing protein, partial [Thermoclostridium sp.]|nr:S-layer homology domain-containing protein [Thermoclostridium sp.]